MRTIAVCLGLLVLAGFAGYKVTRPSHSPGSYERGMATATLAALGSSVDLFHQDTGRYPASLLTLTGKTGQGPYANRSELQDPWGNSYQYRLSNDGASFALWSLGADGRPGGVGLVSDLRYVRTPSR
jgi:general secretion pathway protein G